MGYCIFFSCLLLSDYSRVTKIRVLYVWTSSKLEHLFNRSFFMGAWENPFFLVAWRCWWVPSLILLSCRLLNNRSGRTFRNFEGLSRMCLANVGSYFSSCRNKIINLIVDLLLSEPFLESVNSWFLRCFIVKKPLATPHAIRTKARLECSRWCLQLFFPPHKCIPYLLQLLQLFLLSTFILSVWIFYIVKHIHFCVLKQCMFFFSTGWTTVWASPITSSSSCSWHTLWFIVYLSLPLSSSTSLSFGQWVILWDTLLSHLTVCAILFFSS